MGSPREWQKEVDSRAESGKNSSRERDVAGIRAGKPARYRALKPHSTRAGRCLRSWKVSALLHHHWTWRKFPSWAPSRTAESGSPVALTLHLLGAGLSFLPAFIGSGTGFVEVALRILALSPPGPAGAQGPRVLRTQACRFAVFGQVRTRLPRVFLRPAPASSPHSKGPWGRWPPALCSREAARWTRLTETSAGHVGWRSVWKSTWTKMVIYLFLVHLMLVE